MSNRKNKSYTFIKKFLQVITVIIAIVGMAGFFGCDFSPGEDSPKENWDTLRVTASAYNSVRYQTQGNPNVTAFGDTIHPGMNVIAVSRDLIRKGLDYNTPVRIEGFDEVFLVKDKMHTRWRNKIDIYMGEDVEGAKEWGRKRVEIYYLVPPEDTISTN